MLSAVPLKAELLGIVRAELGRRSWNDAEFARRAGWTQSRMSRALAGKTGLDVDDLETLLAVLGFDPQVMIRGLQALAGQATGESATSIRADSGTKPDDQSRIIRALLFQLAELEKIQDGKKGD